MTDFDTCDYYDSPAEVESILRERVPSWLEEARRG